MYNQSQNPAQQRFLRNPRGFLLAFFALAFMVTGFAQAPSVAYRFDPGPITARQGETFSVDVIVDPQNDPSLSSQSVYVTFNTDVIMLESYEEVAVNEGRFTAGLLPNDTQRSPSNDTENNDGFTYAAVYIPSAKPTNTQSEPYVLVRLNFLATGVDGDMCELKFAEDGGVKTNLALMTGGGVTNLVSGTTNTEVNIQKKIVGPDPVNYVNIGENKYDLCGSTVRLGNTNDVSEVPELQGEWTFVSNPGETGELLGGNDVFNPVLKGAFGVEYEIKWTVENMEDSRQSSSTVIVSFGPDADLPGGLPDGTQDCVDLCLGGDDSENTDGVGLPDDCDCNPMNADTEFRLLSVIPANNILEADYELETDAIVEANDGHVIAKAGRKVTLKPGFHAQAGASFHAYLDDCFEEPVSANALEDAGLPQSPMTTGIAIEKTDMAVIPTIASSETLIRLSVSEFQDISMIVIDQSGQVVRQLMDGQPLDAGQYDYQLQLEAFQPGMYFIQVVGKDTNITRRLVVVNQ